MNNFRANQRDWLCKLGSLRIYDGCCNENVTLKLNFALGWVFLRLFHVCHVIGNKWSAFLLAWHECHEWFSRRGKEWKIYSSGFALSSEPQIWKVTSWFGRLRQRIAPKSVARVQHDYFSSFNKANHWFVALSWSLPSSFLKLPIREFKIYDVTVAKNVAQNCEFKFFNRFRHFVSLFNFWKLAGQPRNWI